MNSTQYPEHASAHSAGQKIAVVLHLFYEDQWPEFLALLGNISERFDLFVTLRPESDFGPQIRAAFPAAKVLACANLGRDVAPFLALLPQLQSYDVVCKFHTKRSEGGHQVWRHRVAGALLGSNETVRTYLDAFARDPDLVLAGPRFAYVDGMAHLFASERALTLVHGPLPRGWGFFAGTMFWCRPQAFDGFDILYPPDCFVAHADIDGHSEHVVERAFGLVAMQAGRKIMLLDEQPVIAHPASLPRNPSWTDTYRTFEQGFDPIDPSPAPAPTAAPIAGQRSSLIELYMAHRGYVSDKWTANLVQYDRLFADRRELPVRLLEIGVQNGGSLQIWSKYFQRSRVLIGCDIDPRCARLRYDDPRITVVVADAASRVALTRIMERCGQFDIIIDDGSHRSGDIIRTFLMYFPTLADGGIYVVEDMHCSYWPDFEGGLDLPTSSIAFFRAVTDVLNRDHWTDQDNIPARFAGFAAAHEIEIDPGVFSTIVSIEFANSMVVLRKGSSAETRLGRRLVRGSTAIVNDEVLALRDGLRIFPDSVPSAELSQLTAPIPTALADLSISVIIPFRNGSPDLPDTIRSVAAQGTKVFETIVVDDGSSPDEAAWLERFARDAGFRIVTQERRGQVAARNAGLRTARGTHVCMPDQGDNLLADHFAALAHGWIAALHGKPRLAWVAGTVSMAEHGQPPRPANADDSIFAAVEQVIAGASSTSPSMVLLDRIAIMGVGGIDEALAGYAMDDLLLRLLLDGYQGAGVLRPPLAPPPSWARTDISATVNGAGAFFDKWMAQSFADCDQQAFFRANLRARLSAEVQRQIRATAPEDRAPLWQLFRQIEVAA